MSIDSAMAVAAPAEPAVTTPVRIHAISLTNFRAFAGLSTARFELAGKNLLLYGENGAGKSSLFHALAEFFSDKPSALDQYNNVFSGFGIENCRVAVELVGDAVPVVWTADIHPCVLDFDKPVDDYYSYYFGETDTRIRDAAKRAACIDYKSLLNTNFSHGVCEVNLFDIAVNHLLRDYPVSHAGQASTIGELWQAVLRATPAKGDAASLKLIIQACIDFNTVFRPALQVLLPKINELLQSLGWPEVTLTALRSPGVTYRTARLKAQRTIEGQTLVPELSFRNHQPVNYQTFLNEARLSALALAIYFAGRLVCTPTTTPDALKLLVLDDVLIGLDHSNRLPVLDVLINLFPTWQVVLLTHDKGWFDLARQRLPDGDWACYEIYEGDQAAAAPLPIVRKTEKRPAKALLDKGRELLALGYVEAAANYTRQAFEFGLRKGCEIQKVPMNYSVDPTAHKSQDFLDALRRAPKPVTVTQADWAACLQRIEMFKNVVMNPYSHPSAPNIPRQEVLDAANAVERFLELAGKK